MQLVKATAL